MTVLNLQQPMSLRLCDSSPTQYGGGSRESQPYVMRLYSSKRVSVTPQRMPPFSDAPSSTYPAWSSQALLFAATATSSLAGQGRPRGMPMVESSVLSIFYSRRHFNSRAVQESDSNHNLICLSEKVVYLSDELCAYRTLDQLSSATTTITSSSSALFNDTSGSTLDSYVIDLTEPDPESNNGR